MQVAWHSPLIFEMIVGSRKEMEEETMGTYLANFPGLALSAALNKRARYPCRFL